MGAIIILLLLLFGMCLYPVAAVIYFKLVKHSAQSVKAIIAEL